jgi:hypothetical protein
MLAKLLFCEVVSKLFFLTNKSTAVSHLPMLRPSAHAMNVRLYGRELSMKAILTGAALMLVITTAEAAENEAPIQVSLQSLRQKTT